MRRLPDRFDRVDIRITRWMARHGITVVRIGLGVVFLWFGALKFVPGLSPAEELVAHTVGALTGGLVPGRVSVVVLAVWETVIGLGLLTGRFLRLTLLLLFLQMPGTMLPVIFFPEEIFTEFPYGLTLEGQYIIKNFVLIGSALVIGATVRGGRLVADPETRAREVDTRRT